MHINKVLNWINGFPLMFCSFMYYIFTYLQIHMLMLSELIFLDSYGSLDEILSLVPTSVNLKVRLLSSLYKVFERNQSLSTKCLHRVQIFNVRRGGSGGSRASSSTLPNIISQHQL